LEKNIRLLQKLKSFKMKKLLAILLLAGVFTACNNGGGETSSADSARMADSINMMNQNAASDTMSTGTGGGGY
jgi:outer membrane PBP1 activator LpoA protein